VLERILSSISSRSVALFLGATDTGKTTLIRELHRHLGGEVIDADVGQSWLGPPACISRGRIHNDHSEIRASSFVGDISPRGNFLPVLTGVAHCLREASRPLLIDTDGYISGDAARIYKSELIRIVRPDVLVLLQRSGELAYYKLYARQGITVIEIPVTHTGSKSREDRIRAREDAFRRYFHGASTRRWRFDELSVERALIGHGEPLDVTLLSNLLACPVVAAWRLPQQPRSSCRAGPSHPQRPNEPSASSPSRCSCGKISKTLLWAAAWKENFKVLELSKNSRARRSRSGRRLSTRPPSNGDLSKSSPTGNTYELLGELPPKGNELKQALGHLRALVDARPGLLLCVRRQHPKDDRGIAL
jgi:hypothetical protein